MKLVGLFFISLISYAYGQISGVQNVVVTPKVQSESTAVIFTWEAPATLGGNAEADLKYSAKVCEINTDKCKESGQIMEKRHEFTGLKRNLLYNYAIYALGKDDQKGEKVEQVFRTKTRDTCAPNEFTCTQSPQCVDPKKKCDGIVNCRDGSDEGKVAECTLPADKPKNLVIEDVKGTSFVVKFQQVGAPDRATGYNIEIVNTATNAKVTQNDDHSNFGVPQRTVEIKGLAEGNEYKVRVRAINRVGAGSWSDYVTASTPGVPLKVRNVKTAPKVQKESTAFILTWDAPSDLAGNTEADIKYMVKYCEINKPDTCKDLPLTTDKRVEITGLKPNNIYTYHITTQGKDDTKGPEYEQIYKTKEFNTCAPNEYACAQAGGCIDPKKKCDGIVNCRDGSDEDSKAECTLPAGKPKNLVIEDVKGTSFVVKFQQVGAPDRATGYNIEIVNTATNAKVTQNDDHSNFGAPQRTVEIKGLSDGTEYKVRVRAINRVGAGSWSDYVTASTPGEPLKLQNVKPAPKIQKESTAFILTWDAPSDLAGNTEADIKYMVKYCEINKPDTCKDLPLTTDKRVEITGLKPNNIYTYHITAQGKDDTKGPEYEQVYKTKAFDTCAPNQYTCVKGGGCIEPTKKCDGIVNCRDASDEDSNAGCTIPSEKPTDVKVEDVKATTFVVKFKKVASKDRATEYDIEILNKVTNEKIVKKEPHNTFGLPIKSVFVNGLKGNTEYKVRVRALNRVGAGLWSDYVMTKTTAPSTKLKVENAKTQAKPLQETTAFILTWDAPSDLNGNTEADIKYMVKYCEINKPDTCIDTPLTADKRVEITGLKPNSIYSYHITAQGKDNEKGAVVEAIYKTQAKQTCLPNQYTCAQSSQCVDPRRKCDGLVNCKDGSDESSAAGCTLPSQKPSGVAIESITDNSFVLKFKQVGAQDRATGYDIEIKNAASGAKRIEKDTHSNFAVQFKSLNIDGVSAGTEYKVRLRAVNRVGSGPWTDYFMATTTGSKPKPKEGALQVKNVQTKPKELSETSAIIITWEAPEDLGDNSESDLKYFVKYCEINQKDTCKETQQTSSKKVELKGLKKDFIYNYEIFAVGKDGTQGTPYDSTFRTEKKRTCESSQFTCANVDGCFPRNRRCDGLINCADSSDEGAHAGCKAPSTSPSEISVTEVTTESFVYNFRQVTLAERATEYDIQILDIAKESTRIVKENHASFGFVTKSKLISGLTPMSKYKIRVRANNRVGSGPWSSYEDVETKGAGQVDQVKSVPAEKSVNLSWQPPPGSTGVFDYVIKYCQVKENAQSTCKEIKTTKRTATVRNLVSGSEYQFEVIAFKDGKAASSAYKSSFKTTGTAPDNGSSGSDGSSNDDNNTTSESTGSEGMSTAQKIGIAVGIILGLLIVIVGVVACIKMKKSKNKGGSRQANGKHNGGYEMDRKA